VSVNQSLRTQYPQEVDSILAQYPADQKRSAVMPLLYLAQRGEMYVTKAAMAEIAEKICEADVVIPF